MSESETTNEAVESSSGPITSAGTEAETAAAIAAAIAEPTPEELAELARMQREEAEQEYARASGVDLGDVVIYRLRDGEGRGFRGFAPATVVGYAPEGLDLVVQLNGDRRLHHTAVPQGDGAGTWGRR